MAQITHLSPIATPGPVYSFSAKGGGSGPKGSDQVTELWALGVPGGIHSFLPKVEPGATSPSRGLQFTLSENKLHYFLGYED